MLDLIKDILDEMRITRHLDIVENFCKIFHRYGRMDPALFFKKIVNKVEQMNAELHEPVRRVGHYEELLHIFRSAFDHLFYRLPAELK